LTRRAYTRWIGRYVDFLCQRPDLRDLPPQQKIHAYLLTLLPTSANTKVQAQYALQWLYRHMLQQSCGERMFIRQGRHFPHLLSHQEVLKNIAKLGHSHQLMAWLCYGSGLSLSEMTTITEGQISCIELRIQLKQRDTILSPYAVPLVLRQQEHHRHLYTKTDSRWLFPSKHPTRPVGLTAFAKACRYHHCDVHFTPSHLRASFIVWAIRKYGAPQAKAWTGLSGKRIEQYLEML
jgi:site-specific recombinase XerD